MMWDWVPWWHWLAMVGIWLLGIAMVVWAVSALFPGQPPPDAHRILDERLARGELDVDEYRRRRDALHTRARPRNHSRA